MYFSATRIDCLAFQILDCLKFVAIERQIIRETR